MLETSNFLAKRGHETHAFASEWDTDTALFNPHLNRHDVAVSARGYLPRLAGFIRTSRNDIAQLNPRADVLAGFGIEAPPDSILWMQSVHRAWIETSRQTSSMSARIKQRLNPAHPVILALEKQRFVKKQYRHVVALSSGVKADLQRFYSVPDSDITVIPNGYAPEEFGLHCRTNRRAEMRANLGFSASDCVIVFVANEIERKGLRPLISAVGLLRDPSVKLLVVGNILPAACEPLVRANGLEGRVVWVGPSSSVGDLYAAADVFALPTRYEAWGLVIVEAMACGLPAVTSRLAGASIAIKNGETGTLLEDPGNPEEIAVALKHQISGKHAGAETISASVQSYQWEHVLQMYEHVLQRFAG